MWGLLFKEVMAAEMWLLPKKAYTSPHLCTFTSKAVIDSKYTQKTCALRNGFASFSKSCKASSVLWAVLIVNMSFAQSVTDIRLKKCWKKGTKRWSEWVLWYYSKMIYGATVCDSVSLVRNICKKSSHVSILRKAWVEHGRRQSLVNRGIGQCRW